MATDGGGKLKPKRSQSGSKPYERRKSLYKKVTDTVKDLLSPSWLTDIVTTVKKSPPKESYPNTIDEEEDEDEMFMSPPQSPNHPNSYNGPPRIASQLENKLPAPQPKRSRIQVPGSVPSVSLNNPAFPCASDRSGSLGPSQTPSSRYTSSINSQQYSAKRPSIHDVSGASQPNANFSVEAQSAGLKLNDVEIQQIKDKLAVGQSRPTVSPQACREKPSSQEPSISHRLTSEVPSKRQRIWQNDVSDDRSILKPAVSDKPSFKASLFGSMLSEKSILGDDTRNESLFYPGRTTFGGSSAARGRDRLNVTAPYQTALPIRKQMKPKLANSSFSAVTSSSARRILESLERMSTPLTDAKKIPMEVPSVPNSLLSFTPSSYRRHSMSFQPSALSRRSLDVPIRSGPPTSQIRTHSIASISKNRHTVTSTPRVTRRQESKTQDTSGSQEKEKTTEIPTLSQSKMKEEESQETTPAWSTGGGKMKREKTHHYSSKKPEEEDIVEVPDLKADFTLPVAKLPQIQFTATPIVKVDDDTAKCISESSKKERTFTFSSPLHQQKPSNIESPVTCVKNFTFSSPLKADEAKDPKPASTSTVGFSFISSTPSTAPKPKNPLLGNGGINFQSGLSKTNVNASSLSTTSSVSSGFQPASVLKPGSVMDVLGSSQSLKQGSVMDILGKSSPAPQGNTLKEGSVMDILGKKDSSNDKKDGAEIKKIQSESPVSVMNKKDEPKEPLSALFAKPAGSWECDVCMIQNNGGKTKCLACGTPNPQLKPQVSIKIPPKEPLSAMLGKKAGSWTCDVCMIQNDQDKTKCAACQTAKPGSKSQAPQKSSLASLFKKAEGSWDCEMCMVQNKPDTTKCISCETPKPGTKNTGGLKSSGISLGSSGKGTITDSGFKFNAEEAKKASTTSGFKLDSAVIAAAPVGGGFKFGGSVTSEKKSDVSDSSEKSAPTGFTFGTQSVKTKDDQKPASGFAFGNQTLSVGDKTESGAGKDKSVGGFSFSNSKVADSDQKSATGFSFGQNSEKTESKVTDKVVDMKPGGFSLGAQSDSSPFGGGTNSLGGFQFQSLNKKTESVDSSISNTNGQAPSVGGFTFGSVSSGNKIQETNNNNLIKEKGSEVKGFTFGLSSASSTGANAGGIASNQSLGSTSSNSILGNSQPKLPNDFVFGAPSSTPSGKSCGLGVFPSTPAVGATNTSFSAPSVKRSINDDSSEPQAKKSFVFGASSSTTSNGPFSFNSGSETQTKPAQDSNNTVTPVFTFGAGSNTTPSSANSGFSFGSSLSSGQAFSASASSTDKPSNPLFTFGAGSSNNQSFGNTSNNFSGAPAAFGSSSFGGNGSTSGTSLGSSQPSVAPAFGASSATPAFGASGQTPAFGNSTASFGATNNKGFSFNATPNLNFGSGNTSTNFQFVGKPNESGSATTAQTPPAAGFAFGGQTPAAPAPLFGTSNFTAPATSRSTSDRQFKRAVRRTAKNRK